MPRPAYKLTKLARERRWQKKYKGRKYYIPFDDAPTLAEAWDEWQKIKARIDLNNTPDPQHVAMAAKLGALPDKLDPRAFDRLQERMEEGQRGFQPPKASPKAIRPNIDTFLARKTAQAKIDNLSKGRVANLRLHLTRFAEWYGYEPLADLSAKTLMDWHTHLVELVAEGTLSRSYALDIMTTTKQFIRWAGGLELCPLPSNIASKDFTFGNTPKKIKTLTATEVKSLLRNAASKTQLYILLALNCGMTQQDISDLRRKEVSLERRTITRKRSKTKAHHDVPTVTYTLWPKTVKLLREHKSEHPELWLTNAKGGTLKTERLEGETYYKNDNVRSAFVRACNVCKIKDQRFKLMRSTGATMLERDKDYRAFVGLYLGHSPRSVAERHYAIPDQERFNEAILWLAKQFGE